MRAATGLCARWAKHMDVFTLQGLAGNTGMNMTKRYVHLSDEEIVVAMERVQNGHKSEDRPENAGSAEMLPSAVSDRF